MNIAYQCLERRNLLAGDLVAGDANGDYYFDSADFVQTMKFGLYETDEAATWESGDWNDNGLFNSGDFVPAFATGKYETGAYDPDATEPVHAAVPFDTEGEAVVTVYYDDSNGTLTAVTPSAFMTTLELRSSSDLFLSSNQRFGLFDRSTTSRWFRLIPNGVPVITLPNALPSGLTLEELQSDLIVDGSLYGGGGLQNVQLM
ncbi:MAG: hypothetical protein R3C28_15175 [Pirellulaceae bacterium]